MNNYQAKSEAAPCLHEFYFYDLQKAQEKLWIITQYHSQGLNTSASHIKRSQKWTCYRINFWSHFM